MQKLWQQLGIDYGSYHPAMVRQKVRDAQAQLVVWYTSKYNEPAGGTMNSNPRFETAINSNITNMSNWISGGHGKSVGCPVECVITDDVRLAETADVLMFEVYIAHLNSLQNS